MPPRTWPLSFSPPVRYVDYAPSVEDILALCMTGFPSFDSKAPIVVTDLSGPRHDSQPGETRPSMFTDEQATDMAATQASRSTCSARERRTTGYGRPRIDWRAVFPIISGVDLSAKLDSHP